MCCLIAEALGMPGFCLSVCFVGERAMRALNRRYLGRDRPTDVLSFAYPGEAVAGRPFLGEIVIAPDVAWQQARRWHTTPEREVCRLMIHGVLHLLGYDHEADAGEMMRLQRKLMRRLLRRGMRPPVEAGR